MATLASLTTTLRNMSGATKRFPFLPPHGVKLADGESFTCDGDIRARLANHPRKFAGLNKALNDGDLVIVESPDEFYYDETKDYTKVIKVVNGAVVIRDPDFGAYSSSL